MNRKKMQEWLDQFPEDTEIEIVTVVEGRWSDEVHAVRFDPTEFGHFDFVNFSDNKFVDKDHALFGHKTLTLGCSS